MELQGNYARLITWMLLTRGTSRIGASHAKGFWLSMWLLPTEKRNTAIETTTVICIGQHGEQVQVPQQIQCHYDYKSGILTFYQDFQLS